MKHLAAILRRLARWWDRLPPLIEISIKAEPAPRAQEGEGDTDPPPESADRFPRGLIPPTAAPYPARRRRRR